MIFSGVASEVIYIPVTYSEPDRSREHRSEIRREFDTQLGAVVIVQVSRMEGLKGHKVHLAALARLCEVPGWVAWFVGGAQRPEEIAYQAELKDAASVAGIEDRVRFIGEHSEIAKILAASDIFCQPNIAPEGFGITFIEALHAGLPVITSALGGSLEIVDSSCGILLPPRNPEAVAISLRKLIEDRELRGRLGAAGPTRAKQLTDPKVQISLLRGSLEATSSRRAVGSERRSVGVA
jgi:glycosyltransferase involved in cell wall biosynthesis